MKQKAVSEIEVRRQLNNLSSVPGYNSMTERAIAKKMLESEFVFCNGVMRDIRVKYMGLGVYKVFSEERK